MTLSLRLTGIIALLFGSFFAHAQIDVVNNGMVIYIPKDNSITINGSYTDNSGNEPLGTVGSQTLDAPILLSGTLYISGNIINNSNPATKMIYQFEVASDSGGVVLNGAGLQTIGGAAGRTVYFPNLTVNKPSGNVQFDRTVEIDNKLTMTSGSLNLNNQTLAFGPKSNIVAENETNRIYGDGSIVLTSYPINAAIRNKNYRGLGIGYKTIPLGNFSDVVWQRAHTPSNFSVANGANALRVYRMKTSTSTSFDSIYFRYHDAEISGFTEGSLALYYSNDNGASWTKAPSDVFPGSNLIRGYNVPAVAHGSSVNIFVIAPGTCAILPDVAIRSAGVPVGASDMNICDGASLQLSVLSVANNDYAWTTTTPQGPSSFAAYPQFPVVYNTHTGIYSVFVRDVHGCENTADITVNVRAIPVAKFSISLNPDNIPNCLGTQLQFTDLSTVAGASTINQRSWDFNDASGQLSAAVNPAFTYTTVGRKIPTLRVTSTHNCQSPIEDDTLYVQTLPTPAFDITDGALIITERCEDLDVTFDNTSTYVDFAGAVSSTLSYSWTFDGGNSSNAENPVHQFLAAGTYNVTLRATANVTQCYRESTKQITIRPEPIPQFNAIVGGMNISQVCEGLYVDFQNTSTMPDATAMTFDWNFDDGETSTQTGLAKDFVGARVYNVVLKATSVAWGCVEDVNLALTVHPAPIGTFTLADPDICIPEQAVITNTSSVPGGTLTNNWNFGDGVLTTDNNTQVTHTYPHAQKFKITLTRISDHGCTNTVSRDLIVHPNPVSSFFHYSACDGDTVKFLNRTIIQSDTIANYHWDFDDGDVSAETDPGHIFPVHDTYQVALTATSTFGCTNTFVAPVEVYRNPSFNLGASITGCQSPYRINPFDDTSAFLPAGTTFSWRNAQQQVLATTPYLDAPATDFYSVIVTTTQQCKDTVNIPLYLFMPVDLGADVNACSSIVLNAEENIPGEEMRADSTHYEWKKNNVVVADTRTLNVSESGTYSVTVTRWVGGNGCSTTDEVEVVIDFPLALSLPAQQTICAGESVLLDAGVTADSYTWTRLNSGETFSGQTLVVTETGDYRLEVANSGCIASATSSVTVSPGPSVSFGSPPSACPGSPVNITDYSYAAIGTIVNREWDFGDATSATNPSPVIKTFAAPGIYTIELTATTDNGCSATFAQQVSIQANPVAGFSMADGCQEENIVIQNTSSPGAEFRWDFGDGVITLGSVAAHAFEDAGNFDVMLEVTAAGCTSSVSHTITVNAKPDLEFGDNVSTCGNSILLDAFNPGSIYRWFDPQNGNATLSTSQQYTVSSDAQIGLEVTNVSGCFATEITQVALNSPVVVNLGTDRAVCDEAQLDAGYLPGGQYNWSNGATARSVDVTSSGFYEVNILDQNGCASNASVNITVNNTPVITTLADEVEICDGESAQLDAGANPSYTYLWSTGANTSQISATVNGSYTVTVTDQNCSSDKTVSVTVHEAPVAAFTAADRCAEQSLSLQNTSSVSSGVLQFRWNFGDGTFSAQATPVKTFSTPGTATIILQAKTQYGCTDELSKQVEINPLPVAAFTVDDACSKNNLVITDQSTYSGSDVLSYQWNFDNGATSSQSSPAYAYPVTGNYQVNLLLTSTKGCSDNYLREVVIGNTPSLISWIPQITTCNPVVVLDAGNAGATYQWSDNSTNQTLSVTHGGHYQVEITSPDGCTATANTDVVINNAAVPQLPDLVENCGSVLLDPVVTAATYLWSTGAQTKTIRALSSGRYTIQLITQNLCISRDTTDVTVNPIPVIELGPNVFACQGEILNIGVQSALPASYQWSTGATTALIDVTQSGNYSVKLTTPKNCEYTDVVTATFHALPVINLGETRQSCGEISLDAENSGSTYQWSTGSTQRTITTSASGEYWVRVTNINSCEARDTVDVDILPVPVVNLGNDITLCNGQTTTLQGGQGDQYLWSDNSTARSLMVGASGVYQLSITNTLGCTGIDEVRVTVRPALPLELGADRLLCNNAGQMLSAGIDNVSYQWGSTTGTTSTAKSIRIQQAGTYWVEISDLFSCKAKDSVTVSPTTENITASFLAPSTVGQGDEVHFAQLSEPKPLSFSWTFGDGGLSNAENPVHRYFRTGDFVATLVVSNSVCSDTLSKTITVRNGRVEVQPTPELPVLIEFVSAASYPNPTRGVVNVEVELTTESEVWIAIYSLKGVAMDEQKKTIVRDVFEFDISNVADGMYLIRVMAANRTKVLKIVKSGGF